MTINILLGSTWRSSGKDSHFPCWDPQVQSLVRELRSHKTRGVAKKEKKKIIVFKATLNSKRGNQGKCPTY